MASMLPLTAAGGRGLTRVAELAVRGAGSGPAKVRSVALSFIASELDFYAGIPHARLRDEGTCPVLGAPPPVSAVRSLPRDGYLPGEPEVPAPFDRALIDVSDDASVAPPPRACPLRRIVVRVFLPDNPHPAAEGYGIKAQP
jgi:hypothetical protein